MTLGLAVEKRSSFVSLPGYLNLTWANNVSANKYTFSEFCYKNQYNCQIKVRIQVRSWRTLNLWSQRIPVVEVVHGREFEIQMFTRVQYL